MKIRVGMEERSSGETEFMERTGHVSSLFFCRVLATSQEISFALPPCDPYRMGIIYRENRKKAMEKREVPAKELAAKVEGLEKENFGLKMEICHLKKSIPKRREEKAIDHVLADAEATIKALAGEKEILMEENARAVERAGRAERERDEMAGDCRRLSSHIREKEKSEEENQKIISELKGATARIREGMGVAEEEMARGKRENGLLREEIERLVRENERMRGEVEEGRRLSVKCKELLVSNESFMRRAEEREREKGLLESVIETLKREKKEAQAGYADLRVQAEALVKEREREVSLLAGEVRRRKEEAGVISERIRGMERTLGEEVRRVGEAEIRSDSIKRRVEELGSAVAEAIARSKILEEQASVGRGRVEEEESRRMAMEKEKERMERECEDVRRSLLKTEREKEAIVEQIRIEPDVYEKLKSAGISEFRTLNEVLVKVFKVLEERGRVLERKLSASRREREREEAERQEKIEVFQRQLEDAFSELDACRRYLESKKEEVRMARRMKREQLLGTIAASRIK
jgi:chromosome segregation ATPase